MPDPPAAGATDPDARQPEPNVRQSDPDAWQSDPNAGQGDPDSRRREPDARPPDPNASGADPDAGRSAHHRDEHAGAEQESDRLRRPDHHTSAEHPTAVLRGAFHPSLLRRFLVVAAILVLLIPATMLVRSWFVARVGETAALRQQEAAAEALSEIAYRFEVLQHELAERAERIAEHPEVVRGMRNRLRSGLTAGPAELVHFFAELDPPALTSLELYAISGELVAWNGFEMPLQSTSGSELPMGEFRVAIASDDGLREALVVWWPVRDGSRVLGAVRAMHTISYDAPVRNEYLQDVSLSEDWSRLTGLPVRVRFGYFDAEGTTGGEGAGGTHGMVGAEAAGGTQDIAGAGVRPSGIDVSPGARSQDALGGAPARMLVGIDGTVLGRVSVQPPSAEELQARAADRFNDVLALWAVLAMFWLFGGVWHLYRRALKTGAQRGSKRVRAPLPAVALFGGVTVSWWTIRYALLWLDVPARWQTGKAPLSPLFDPIHLASDFAGGLMRSTGDFLLSTLFFAMFAVAVVDLAYRFREDLVRANRFRRRTRQDGGTSIRSTLIAASAVVAGTILVECLTILVALPTRHVVLDSTFDFFARKGLLPEPLILVVFCGLIILTMGVILASVAVVWVTTSAVLRWMPSDLSAWKYWLTIALGAAVPLLVVYTAFPLASIVPWTVSVAMLALAISYAAYLRQSERSVPRLLLLRSIVPSIFLVTVLLYPMLYNGMSTKRRIRMIDTAQTFAEGRDPRALFAIDQLLHAFREDDRTRRVLDGPTAGLDSLALNAFQGSLLASLPAYDISLTFYDSLGRPIGRYFDTGQVLDRSAVRQIRPISENILRQMYEESGGNDVLVATVTGTREPDRLQYGGITPVRDEERVLGWITARAIPVTVLTEGRTLFPRMLLPSGSYADLLENLSVAEFRDGLLVRTVGRDFGRYRLSDDILLALAAESSVWRREEIEERSFLTYYHRQERGAQTTEAAFLPSTVTSIVAVRVPSISMFDHLFYLLRLTVSGFFLGFPLYLFGLYARQRAGLIPAPRVRFRDKVLSAFLAVGTLSVTAVGIVGLQVVTEENEHAVQSWLRQHLERVEEALALDATGEEMPYSVLDRIRIDSLAARVGLDLNVFESYELVDLSRPQLLQDRLIDGRLPIEAYEAIYFDGHRFVYTDERIGNFEYTAGFRALPDEQGSPRYVVSVPTLPEQEQLEEERTRTVAYLFGSMLLLLIAVTLTAMVVASAISRPIARLRSGLQAVAAGRFERKIPVSSRDEIGELVETFNQMQEQLSESRTRLAQQERQLAWREMARQVAHEIKNPLTPMKLSVQHLRRAFRSASEEEEDDSRRFGSMFDRITTTLIEQIDTLARIANEFHSFARMPTRVLERADLNAVVEEAVSLMQEDSDVEITTDLVADPLFVDVDREELRRIYINLIKNAIEATPEAGGRVHVATRRQAEAAYSSVTDSGTGVPEDLRDRIFEPNFSTKTSGTGLGLAIAKKGVEEMLGEIGFETEVGEGSTFWIILPLARDEEGPGD